MVVHNIIFLSQRGRVICNAIKEQYIWKLTSYHLVVLQKGFFLGEFDGNLTKKHS